MDSRLLFLLCIAPALVLSQDPHDLAHGLIHKAQANDVDGEIEGWQMEKLKDFIKLIQFQKFIKHGSQESQFQKFIKHGSQVSEDQTVQPSSGFWWSIMHKVEAEKKGKANQQKVGLFKELLGFMNSFQAKKKMVDEHRDYHDDIEAKEHLKTKMAAFEKHENLHDFMEAMEKKKKMAEAMKKHEEVHTFLEALAEKKKMIEAMKQHKEFHDFLEMMEAHKKKMESMKKHSDFHEYMDAVEEHKQNTHTMEKWNTMLALHGHAHKEEDFAELMMGLMQKKRQFVFTIVFELMKFCKCKESIDNLHRFFSPDLHHDVQMSGNHSDIVDIDEHIKYFHTKSEEQAKTLFMKGMLKTLCLTAKGYVQHVKSIATRHFTQHFLEGDIGHGNGAGFGLPIGRQIPDGNGIGDGNGDVNVNVNGVTQSSNGVGGSSGSKFFQGPNDGDFGGSQTMNGF